ncbi:MAG: VWA domain-containing protein, partial [Candidatus Obscuribacterales bacterium]|nr:VWA domain-containing protein [Candidatus Obscuribacterales bacterium]
DTIAWLAANELEISSAPGQGSAMGDAFELAFRFFDVDSDSKRQKMVILICDGGTDDNTNLEAIADGCRQRSIELTILGTGGMAPALIPVEELSAYDRMMASGRFYETGGKPASSSLDLKSLGQLNAHCQPDSRLTQVRAGFDFQLESLVSKRTYIKKPGNREIFFYPCLIFFVSLCIAALSIGRRKNNSFQENLR